MGARRLMRFACVLALAACGNAAPVPTHPERPAQPAKPATMRDRVVADFERAVKTSQDAFVELFDFVAVGELEILLHRYDLDGRLPDLPPDLKMLYELEDGTPYPPERERRNVGNFYAFLAQRTVGTGGCVAAAPRTRYGKLLGVPFDALPTDTPPDYEKLRTTVNGYLAKGGVVGITCSGGNGGLALVWTEKPNPRGYDLITIYDD
jgi:hypothetical protein